MDPWLGPGKSGIGIIGFCMSLYLKIIILVNWLKNTGTRSWQGGHHRPLNYSSWVVTYLSGQNNLDGRGCPLNGVWNLFSLFLLVCIKKTHYRYRSYVLKGILRVILGLLAKSKDRSFGNDCIIYTFFVWSNTAMCLVDPLWTLLSWGSFLGWGNWPER